MFPDKLSSLNSLRPISKSNPLSYLSLYVNADGLVRVGGRFRHAQLPESKKHPIVLLSHPLLARLIERHYFVTLYGGPQITFASFSEEYWILRARATVRLVLYKCVWSTRENAKITTELMGDLPEVRVTRGTRAFIFMGVNYAGPVAIRAAPGRDQKLPYAYIALFICLSTKAVHLELVSDYISATFIAAYYCFVSRRGLPQQMYSDN